MGAKIPKRVEKILAELKEGLKELYPRELKDVVLFGSYARGDYSQGSDVDLLLLLDKQLDYSSERKRYLNLASDISLKYDILVSIIPMEAAKFRSMSTPLIRNIQREGVRL